MSYYQINRDKLLKKAKIDIITNRWWKRKATKYYDDNQDVLKGKAEN